MFIELFQVSYLTIVDQSLELVELELFQVLRRILLQKRYNQPEPCIEYLLN